MAYTTISKVREFSGFDNATNITGSTIRGKISMADSRIDGALGYRYLLPLAYHRAVSLTFSGEGTGVGTLTVVVNGSSYDVAISNTLTASAAADLFRIAVVSNNDFIVDGFISEEANGDAVVTLISNTDSSDLTTANAEINITDAGGTVQGITGTAGTVYDRYPQIIEQLSTEIATALLLFDNYGIEAQDTPKDGVARMERLNEMLLQLQGTDSDLPILRVYDEVTKVELAQSSTGLPSFRATDTTSNEDYTGDDRTIPNVQMISKF